MVKSHYNLYLAPDCISNKTGYILIHLVWESSCLDCFPAGIIHQSRNKDRKQKHLITYESQVHKTTRS